MTRSTSLHEGSFLFRGIYEDLLLEGDKFPRGDDCHAMATALDLALVGMLEGGADGDDLAWSQHL